ncbi:adenosylcobalamin-dependent ribonucleoside-diphosphate reductase [Antrihabitans sp. YC3-6]|uniref:ribonucleoside-diphosphate reductase n=1 Tax=Antrihabitans stalagmiti TaxID=2799499 RepID=A0A934NU79_9NOCA|nr:adenosylcobalamin-dependent ribonucleoside-diphosphate reductase [Antrihabitans stalagmiti]MBJ8341255.1 adenosylcobalamin-dependent ribonucleoside-diphosphate reductase [Antrihabitans stalagmiti]
MTEQVAGAELIDEAELFRKHFPRRDECGRSAHTMGELCERVGTFVAAAEDQYGAGKSEEWAARFTRTISACEFLPNLSTLVSAYDRTDTLADCFVLPVDDSLRSVIETLGRTAVLQQHGAGVGINFSHVRPRGDLVEKSGGTAGGPLSILQLFDSAQQVFEQGRRRPAPLRCLVDVTHPDIFDIVGSAAMQPAKFQHIELSVGVTDEFVRATLDDDSHMLVHPRTGRTVRAVRARELHDAICAAVQPKAGLVVTFIDAIDRANPLGERVEATSPCGDVPLLAYESCALGSVNLARFVVGGTIDWGRLDDVVRMAVRFLDDTIDVSGYPFPELEWAAKATRKIGVGVLGLADALACLDTPYDSRRGVHLAARIAEHIQRSAHSESIALAESRGRYPEAPHSLTGRARIRRNAQVTSIGPTDTTSMLAGTTPGIEPMRDVQPEWHLRMQATFQRHVDGAVSKTIELPADADIAEIGSMIVAAWRSKAKSLRLAPVDVERKSMQWSCDLERRLSKLSTT